MRSVFILSAMFCAAALGCSRLDKGASLTEEVTAKPSAAFMKKVADDPFPSAGQPSTKRTAAK